VWECAPARVHEKRCDRRSAGCLVCGVLGTLVVVTALFSFQAHCPRRLRGIGLACIRGIPALGATLFSGRGIHGDGGCGASKAGEGRHDHWRDVGPGHGARYYLNRAHAGYNVDLMSYLFGSILSVPGSDIWYMLCLISFDPLFVFYFYKSWWLCPTTEEFSFCGGHPARALYFVLLG